MSDKPNKAPKNGAAHRQTPNPAEPTQPQPSQLLPAVPLPRPTQLEFAQHLQALASQAVRVFIESALREELTAALQAQWAEQTTRRKGYRNGFYNRDLLSSAGLIEDLKVPRDRQGQYRTQLFERYSRYEPTVKATVEQMFVGGLSTDKVGQAVAPLLGQTISSSAVSRIHQDMEGQFQFWRERALPVHLKICYLDAVLFTVRHGEKADQVAVLVALGVDAQGHKELLALKGCAEENKTGWSDLLQDLRKRGVGQIDLIISDGHDGLIKAIEENFSATPRQRCLAHKERNIMSSIPKRVHQEVGGALRGIWQQPDKAQAHLHLEAFKLRYEKLYPEAVKSLQEEAEQTLTFYDFPVEWHRYIKTTNAIESLFSTVRRRTDRVQVFTTEQSCLLLFWSVVKEVRFQKVPI